MNAEQFWKIIDNSRRGAADDADKQTEQLKKALIKLGEKETLAFEDHYCKTLYAADSWDLRGAACVVFGEDKDEAFEAMRNWIISRGKKVYDEVTKTPDALSKLAKDGDTGEEYEEFGTAAAQAFEEITGKTMPRSKVKEPAKPKGREWDIDDDKKLAKKFSKLWELFGSDEEE